MINLNCCFISYFKIIHCKNRNKMKNENTFTPTGRTKLRTLPKRGDYNIETIYNILDASFICYIGFSNKNQPFVIPVAFGRKDNKIYFHGGKGSRLFKTIKKEIDICINVTIVDGIVLAKSAFHHSINYRSVVIFGKTEEVTSKQSKIEGLKTIMDNILPGRWEDVRIPNEKELNATTVLSVNLEEASAKIRTGPSTEEETDLDLNIWSGIIPLDLKRGIAVPSKEYNNIQVPDYINNYIRRRVK